ncbi:unnamed protein product, partial [Brenthis ino]
MESSDESFIWTDASSDSDMATDVKNENGKDESDTDFKYKRELLQDVDKQSKEKAKKRKHIDNNEDITHEQKKHKQIKSEAESDIDLPKKKRKKRSESILNNSDTKETLDEIDNYLNIRIKQEQESFVEPIDVKPKKKKKHKKDLDSSDSQKSDSLNPQSSLIDNQTIKLNSDSTRSTLNEIDDYLNYRVKLEQDSFVELNETKTKKKKSKKNIDASISDSYDSQSTVEGSTINQGLNSEERSYENKKMRKKNKDKSKDKNCCADSEEIENHENNISKNRKSICKDDNDTYDEKEIVQNAYIDCDENNVNSSTKNNISEPENGNISDEKEKSINNNKLVSNTSDACDSEQSRANKSFSDRLRFEDDNSADFECVNDEQDKNLPKHIKQFVKINKHLTPTSAKIHSDHFVSEDDEVWIIKCPNEFDIKDFKDITLTLLDNKCKMKLNGQTYDGAFDDSIQRVPILALDKNRKKTVVKNMPIMGLTKFRKRLPKAHIPDQGTFINNLTNFIPLPETKCRHPLFGINYKKAIKIPPSIAERLNGPIEESSMADSVKKKKKKHKKETCKTESECDVESEQIVDIQPVTSSKKKRKRKHSDELDSPPSKSKRIKHDPDSAEAWESEQAIKNNLFGLE